MHRITGLAAHAITAALLVLVAGLTLASTTNADEMDTEVRAVAKRLQCPICESVSVADSPSELAGQMRSVIRTKLEQGESSDQIVAYFVDRYGETVLVEPPRHGVGLLVWLGPIAVLLIGGLTLALWFRRPRLKAIESNRIGPSQASRPTDWRLNAAQRELEEMSEGRTA